MHWSQRNVKWKSGKIKLKGSLTKDENDHTIIDEEEGKTENSERTIFITPLLREILEPRVKENEPESLVFSNEGKIISVSTLNAHFKKICKNRTE